MKRIFIPLLSLLLISCSRPTPEPLPPEEIVARAAEHMQNALGFNFLIARDGAHAFIDANETISFRRAEGVFVAPDKAQAQVRVIGPGLIAEVEVVSLGDRYWETNVLTGVWEELPPEMGFNPALLFDPETGLQPVLDSDLRELVSAGLVELEDIPGKSLYLVTGVLDGARLFDMSFGLIGPDMLEASIWVDPETFEIFRLQMIEPDVFEGEDSIWSVDFWGYGEVTEIVPPIEGGN